MTPKRNNQYVSFLSNNTLAYILMTLSCIFWVGGYVFSNQNKLHPFQTNFSRSIFIIVFSYVSCRLSNSPIIFKNSNDFKLLFIRSLFLIIHGLTMAWVQFYLPIPITHTLGCTGALFVFAVQYFHAGIKITTQQGISVVIAFFGILLTANGRQIYKLIDPSFQFTSSFQNYASDSYSAFLIASTILIFIMILWSFAVYITQSVHANGYQTSLHFGLMNFILSSLALFFLQNKSSQVLIYQSYIWTGVPLGLGEISFTLALAIGQNVGLVSIVGYSTVVIGYILSILRYSEGINFVCLIGTIFVIGGVIKITFQKSKQPLHDEAHGHLSKTDVFLQQITEFK